MAAAVPSTFNPANYVSEQAWKTAVADSDVRCQWDPDHSPSGGKLARRAIQLGLRGMALRAFATEELLEVIDDLRANSFDYYAAIRSAYYQRRQALVSDMDPTSSNSVDIPDYEN